MTIFKILKQMDQYNLTIQYIWSKTPKNFILNVRKKLIHSPGLYLNTLQLFMQLRNREIALFMLVFRNKNDGCMPLYIQSMITKNIDLPPSTVHTQLKLTLDIFFRCAKIGCETEIYCISKLMERTFWTGCLKFCKLFSIFCSVRSESDTL